MYRQANVGKWECASGKFLKARCFPQEADRRQPVCGSPGRRTLLALQLKSAADEITTGRLGLGVRIGRPPTGGYSWSSDSLTASGHLWDPDPTGQRRIVAAEPNENGILAGPWNVGFGSYGLEKYTPGRTASTMSHWLKQYAAAPAAFMFLLVAHAGHTMPCYMPASTPVNPKLYFGLRQGMLARKDAALLELALDHIASLINPGFGLQVLWKLCLGLRSSCMSVDVYVVVVVFVFLMPRYIPAIQKEEACPGTSASCTYICVFTKGMSEKANICTTF